MVLVPFIARSFLFKFFKLNVVTSFKENLNGGGNYEHEASDTFT